MPSSSVMITNEGRKGVASLIKSQPMYLALGNLTTTTPWTDNDTPANFPIAATKLENEIVRQRADFVEFVTPDPSGDIVSETGATFIVTTNPTNTLVARFLFNPTTSQQLIYQYGLFLNTVPRMEKPAMTFLVNNSNGYQSGDSQIQIDTIVGGTMADLLPVRRPRSGYGRIVTIGGTQFRIIDVDLSSQIIYLDNPLTASLANNAPLSTPALTGIPSGQKQLVPSEVFSPGDIFLARNVSPITRQPGSRTQLDIIFTV